MSKKPRSALDVLGKRAHPLVIAAIFLALIGVLGLIFKSFLGAAACVVGMLVIASFFWGIGRIEAWFRRRRDVRNPDLKELLSPDWEFYQRHLSRKVPDGLRNLYADQNIVSRLSIPFQGKENEWEITAFVPISKDELFEFEHQDGLPEHPLVPLATTDLGDPIYLKPGPTESDAVWIWEHELQKSYKLADSPEEFIEKLQLKR